MPTKLVNVELEEISLVKNPANKDAKILFKKSKEGDSKMEISTEEESVLKKFFGKLFKTKKFTQEEMDYLEGLEADEDKEKFKMMTPKEREDAMKCSKKSASKKPKASDDEGEEDGKEDFDGNENEKEKKKKASKKASENEEGEEEDFEDEDEEAEKKKKSSKKEKSMSEIDKSQLPEEVVKKLDELETLKKKNAEIEKANAEAIEKAETLEFTAKAEKEYPNIPGKPEEKGALLRKISKLDKGLSEEILKVYKIANDRIGETMKEKGNNTHEKPDVEKQLEDMAKRYQESNKDLTYQQAYSEVIKSGDGLALYNKYNEEKGKK